MIEWPTIVRLPVTGSTMDEIDVRAKAGAPEGFIVVAGEQTAGRGRMGRQWVAPPESSLLMSLLLRPGIKPEALTTLPLMIGLAVANAIESFTNIEVMLKWPNDLLIDGKKLAGILLQTRLTSLGLDYVIAGIGINLTTESSRNRPGAINLESIATKPTSVDSLLDVLVVELRKQYENWLANAGRPSLAEWRTRAAYLGDEVSLIIDDNLVRGTFQDIDQDGRLLLRRENGEIRSISSGEIIRGPRPMEESTAQ